MRIRKRTGFTLVELLVVVVIIAALVALLLPAILGARARARLAQCTDHQRQLATAILNYETAKDQLPGYVDSFAGTGNLSWTVIILPYMERSDIWDRVREGNLPAPGATTLRIPEFLCPSAGRTEEFCPLDYVVNCGIQDGTTFPVPDPNEPNGIKWTSEGAQFGLFFNKDVVNFPNQPSTRITVRTDKLPDGATKTLLLSENLQATFFIPYDNSNNLREVWEQDVGMLYSAEPGECGVSNDLIVPVNQCRQDLTPFPRTNPPVRYARPSSFHPDVVVAAYADGHCDNLSTDTDYQVYQQLMCPDDAATKLRD